MAVGLIDMGYSLLCECGFSQRQARDLSRSLVEGNIKNVVEKGCIDALTGPVERNDIETVKKHLSVLDGERLQIYSLLALRLTDIASKKNKEREYTRLKSILHSADKNLPWEDKNEHNNNF